MPQKRTGGRKKGGASGKKKGTRGGGRKASKPKKANPKQSPAKQTAAKKEKPRKRDEKENNKASGENGGGGEKRETVGNVVDEFRGQSGEYSKENLPPMNPIAPGMNTASKDTNTQTQSQENLPIPPIPVAAAIPKPKRIKDPSVMASKLQIQGIAAVRSLQCSALILPESFLMNRFGATFIPPQNFQSTSGEAGKMSREESDTASTSGDED
uniref:Uncharacterized protein n=1 Tax=Panagrolaimus superbus TaxID=310955 RepID=A0A914YE04_9BILA